MRAGRCVILDWDLVSVGPAAWDHAPLMTWGERWGGHPDTYSLFAAGYERDFRRTSIGESLARVRLLAATIGMITRGGTSEPRRREAQLRMRYWRGDPYAPAWTAQ
jgi:hypothetical protein